MKFMRDTIWYITVGRITRFVVSVGVVVLSGAYLIGRTRAYFDK